jgi:hypothetical protein
MSGSATTTAHTPNLLSQAGFRKVPADTPEKLV